MGAILPNDAAAVRAIFEENGISVAEWARSNGFSVRTVRAVIRGELKAKRGKGHKIAVALGMKKAPEPRRALVS